MWKKVGLISVTFSSLLLMNRVFYSEKIDTYKVEKYASCSITGTESNVTVTASSSDKTSGIRKWYCRKTDGTWEACPNSSNCSSYSITGWKGYDMIKLDDNASNVSKSTSLYRSGYNNPSGSRDNDSLFEINVGSNAVHITGTNATVGKITSAKINNSRKIVMSGYPDTLEIPRQSTSRTDANSIQLCPAGKPVERNGSYYCEAPNYRLQNDTCVCVYKKNSSNKWELDLSGGWKSKYVCERRLTYCSDEYDPNASDDEIYNVITRRKPNNQNILDDSTPSSNSNMYTRPAGSLCYTYYKTDGDGKTYYGIFPNDWYSDFPFYKSKIVEYHNNTTTYPPLPASDGMKKRMIQASKDTSVLCNGSATGTTTGDDYYSAHVGSNWEGKEGICQFIRDQLNAGNTDIQTMGSSTGIMVPVISSATCTFNGAKANTVGYSEQWADLDNNLLYYCTAGTIDEKKCVSTTDYTETVYSYNWEVSYYKK